MKIFLALFTSMMFPFILSGNITDHHTGYKSCGGFPFGNWNLTVEHQLIRVKVDEDLYRARFEIDYRIRSDSAAVYVPFLFDAVHTAEDLEVTVNGRPVPLLSVPQDHRSGPAALKTHYPDNIFGTALQRFEDTDNRDPFSGLHYIKTRLDKGEHIVRLTYTSYPYVVLNRWLKKVEYRFDLSNAKFWHSFGAMEVEVDLEGCDCYAQLNIGDVNVIRDGNIYHWSFNSLPDDQLVIRPVPKVTYLTHSLLSMRPETIGFIVAVVLMGLHLFYLIGKRMPQGMTLTAWDWVVLGGIVVFILFNYYFFLLGLVLTASLSIYLLWSHFHLEKWPGKMPEEGWGMLLTGLFVIPYIALRIIHLYYERIDSIIGQNASGYHGYILFTNWLYPVYVFQYLILILFVFNWLKIKYILERDRNRQPLLV